jgi:hypothetical protein
MLRIGRNTSTSSLTDVCPHCPQNAQSQRRAVHRLPCGHKLCTQALRNTIKTATDGKPGIVPTCCNVPIPGHLVEHVMTQAEQTALLERLELRDEATSIASSMQSERRPSEPAVRPHILTSASRTISEESKVDSVAPPLPKEVENMSQKIAYRDLREEQTGQRDRFVAWICGQRSELEGHHDLQRRQLRDKHETALEELSESHMTAIADAEDKQVQAEADMRALHEQERRDNATALKHMEAYCAGVYGSGEPHNRTVTDQDRAEVEKTRRTRDLMDAKQASAINVLRGEQSRRMRLRSQRQEREEQELRRQQRREELDLERVFARELSQLNELALEKKKRMRGRWQLQTAIVVRKLEVDGGHEIESRIPFLNWHSETAHEKYTSPGAERENLIGDPMGISAGLAMQTVTQA